MRYLLFSLLVVLLAIAACRLDNVTDDFSVSFAYEYYPLKIGRYVTYQVDSIIFNSENNNTVSRGSTTFARELIADTLRDNTGQLAYRIERYERTADTLPWNLVRVWTASRTETQAIRTEDNNRFIKLIFPLRKGKTWEGNAHIDPATVIKVSEESIQPFKNWSYEVLSVDKQETLGRFRFDSVATVQQANNENLIELRLSNEKYAKNVGLVYKEMRILDTQKILPGEDWLKKAQKGFVLTQRIIDYN